MNFFFRKSLSSRYLNHNYWPIKRLQMRLLIKICWIQNFEVKIIDWFNSFFVFWLVDLDDQECINYRNTLLRMLFDRWQHCRQMGNTARNIFNLSSMTETNNESFINDMYTLISNTAYLASIIRQNRTMMVKKILTE